MKIYKSSSREEFHICTESNTLIIKKLFTKKEYYLTQIVRVEKINHMSGPTINVFLPNFKKVMAGFNPTPTPEKIAQELFSILTNYTKAFYISDNKKELIIYNKFPNLSPDYQPIITIKIDDLIAYRPLCIDDFGTYGTKNIVKLDIVLVTKDSKEYTIPYIFKTMRANNPIAIEAYQSHQRDLAFFSNLLDKKK